MSYVVQAHLWLKRKLEASLSYVRLSQKGEKRKRRMEIWEWRVAWGKSIS